MKNAEMPAMPQSLAMNNEEGYTVSDFYGHNKYNGLTKREMFAVYAMQGILANSANDGISFSGWDALLAENSIKAADALLAELEK